MSGIECSYQIFCTKQINSCLSAQRSINHGKECGRYESKMAPHACISKQRRRSDHKPLLPPKAIRRPSRANEASRAFRIINSILAQVFCCFTTCQHHKVNLIREKRLCMGITYPKGLRILSGYLSRIFQSKNFSFSFRQGTGKQLLHISLYSEKGERNKSRSLSKGPFWTMMSP